ncbi:uncharacterized protein LOC123219027 isoform X2 [Mangifera indica]|uniref:uncharacterized protein LOC123219027 isoform X2 n=1 Tax=Mangifera indica TaxID=29780 RepID=UPI001CF9BA85|nr:uncharacterized protein LOC123219027 isoform X2 [Mangifera indica]
MGAVAFYPQSLLSFNKELKFQRKADCLRKRHLFNLAEIADCTSLFASQKSPQKLTIVSIRSDESRRGRPPQKGSDAGRTKKGDGNQRTQLSDGKALSSSNQEEIIALFKQIQSSISQGDPVSMKKRDRIPSDGKRTVESVIDILHHARKQVKDVQPMMGT